jgi:hypothetical protein
MKWRDKGPEVRALQEALIAHGFALDKYGADGELGGETWSAVESFARVDHLLTSRPLPIGIVERILNSPEKPRVIDPAGYCRVEGLAKNVHGSRAWTQIDGIMLHQAGVWMTDTPVRFRRLNAHVGILNDHPTPIVQVHDLTGYVYHGNEENPYCMGIELNGHFPGLASDYDSKRHTSRGPGEDQIAAARRTIEWMMRMVASHGGNVKRIVPHRVSNDTRRSDPGELAWREIGLWAQSELGLSDGGPGYCVGDGRPIPHEWVGLPAYARFGY